MSKNSFVEIVDKIHDRITDKERKEYIEIEELGAQVDTPTEVILKKDDKRSD